MAVHRPESAINGLLVTHALVVLKFDRGFFQAEGFGRPSEFPPAASGMDTVADGALGTRLTGCAGSGFGFAWSVLLPKQLLRHVWMLLPV